LEELLSNLRALRNYTSEMVEYGTGDDNYDSEISGWLKSLDSVIQIIVTLKEWEADYEF